MWDKLGPAIVAASPVCWDPVQNSNQHNQGESMKVKINIEWRKSKQEPEAPENVIRDALKMAGWTVGHIEVQGAWDEDKPATPQGPWNQDRLPHEWIVDGFLTGK